MLAIYHNDRIDSCGLIIIDTTLLDSRATGTAMSAFDDKLSPQDDQKNQLDSTTDEGEGDVYELPPLNSSINVTLNCKEYLEFLKFKESKQTKTTIILQQPIPSY